MSTGSGIRGPDEPQYTCGIELELILIPKECLAVKFPDLESPAYPFDLDWVKVATLINWSRPDSPPVLAHDTVEFDEAEESNIQYESWTCVRDGSLKPREGECEADHKLLGCTCSNADTRRQGRLSLSARS